jgi:hypothetical protein
MPTRNAINLASLKRKELIQLCKEHGIKGVGKNGELIERLLQAAPNVFIHHEQEQEQQEDENERMNPFPDTLMSFMHRLSQGRQANLQSP